MKNIFDFSLIFLWRFFSFFFCFEQIEKKKGIFSELFSKDEFISIQNIFFLKLKNKIFMHFEFEEDKCFPFPLSLPKIERSLGHESLTVLIEQKYFFRTICSSLFSNFAIAKFYNVASYF